MLPEILVILIGGGLLVFLANIVINKSVALAEHFGFSETLVGMTVLSIGTSLPEILTHIAGSVQILKDPSVMDSVSSLVVGTNIGSDIFQQNLVLSIVAFFGILTVSRKKNFPIIGGLIGAAVILWLMSFNHFISRWEGVVLVIGYAAYVLYLEKKGIREEIPFDKRNRMSAKKVFFAFLLLIGSFVVMAFAANEVLKAAQIIVAVTGISASFFGVLILGLVAAFPELFTAIVAVRKKRSQMSAGILLGSNITNPAFALGLGAIISNYTVPSVIVFYDLPVKIGTALLIFWFLWKDEKIRRSEATVLILIFIAYLIFRGLFFPADIV